MVIFRARSAFGYFGNTRANVSSSLNLPASMSCSTAVAVNILPIDAREKRVCSVLRMLSSRLANPKACAYNGLSCSST